MAAGQQLGFSLFPLTVYGQGNTAARRSFLEARVAEWDSNIPQWLQEVKLPGASMVLIDDGKVFWQREFGVKNADTKEPVDRDTVFANCSNTKPVLA